MRSATLLKERPCHKYFLVNFAKFLRTPFSQSTSKQLLLKWSKMNCLPLLIAFSSLSDINTTLKIGITITWSFTLCYVIAITSLWCWKKISYNGDTSISIRNRFISRCKSNQKPMSPQYRVPTKSSAVLGIKLGRDFWCLIMPSIKLRQYVYDRSLFYKEIIKRNIDNCCFSFLCLNFPSSKCS